MLPSNGHSAPDKSSAMAVNPGAFSIARFDLTSQNWIFIANAYQ